MRKHAYVWVCEMKCGRIWHPTVPAFINKEDAEEDLQNFLVRNPDWGKEFRIRKYVRAGK